MSPEAIRFIEEYDEPHIRQTLARRALCRSREGMRTWFVAWPAIPVPVIGPAFDVAVCVPEEVQPCAA